MRLAFLLMLAIATAVLVSAERVSPARQTGLPPKPGKSGTLTTPVFGGQKAGKAGDKASDKAAKGGQIKGGSKGGVFGGSVQPPFFVPQPTTPVAPTTQTEEQTLWAAGLGTDAPALLEFFHARAISNPSGDKLLMLARQLGDPSAEVRSKAATQLIGAGPAAIGAVRRVVNDLEDRVAAENATVCLEWIEGPRRTEVPIAAARTLAKRKPAGAAEALFGYLPLADDAAVIDAIKEALLTLARSAPDIEGDGAGPEAALQKALQSPVPLCRAIAVEVLCGSGQTQALPEVRKLLGDPKPDVRLRSALALAQRLDEEAIGVLISLLAELAPAQRQEAEAVLKHLAGEWSPNPVLARDDEVSREILRAAWAGWWQSTTGPALLAAFRKRTLTKDDLDKVLALIEKLGDKTFANRERAAADLAAMGPMVVPLLLEASKSSDLERSKRAEVCLKQIAQNEDKHKLPPAAARLLAVRKPAGATEALLAFVPFTDDEAMKTEIGSALKVIAVAAGKPDPALVTALEDVLPMRRMLAAEAIIGAGFVDQGPALKKLLADPEMAVRLKTAMTLIHARHRDAVPALIDLVAELPREQSWQVEELLLRLAGDNAPKTPTGADATARKKHRDDWKAWWESHGDKVDLDKLQSTPAALGFTLIVEFTQQNPNAGRITEVDRSGKVRWQFNFNQFPMDGRLLPGDRVLVAESNSLRITERDLKGGVVWQSNVLPGQPTNTQRLPDGNTLAAVRGGAIVELDKNGTIISHFNVENGVSAAFKTPDGQVVCVNSQNQCLRLDANRKELKRFVVNFNQWSGGIDVTPQGHILVPGGDGTIREYDLDGKVVWQAKTPANQQTGSCTRLPNGHTLVCCQTGEVFELDPTGRVVWEYRAAPGFVPIRARRR